MKNFKSERGIGLMPFILVFVAVLVIAGIIVGAVIVNKKLNKEPISLNAFKDKMQYRDFEIADNLEQYKDFDYIKKACIALEEDYEYQIEFCKLDEEEDAISFYNTKKEMFEQTKGTAQVETKVSMGNNSKYTLKTNGKYKVVSRIEKTVIVADVDEKYEDEVKEILKEIGY